VHQLLLNDTSLDPTSVPDALRAVFGDGRLAQFLGVGTLAFRGFRPTTNAPRDQTLDVDLYQMLCDWVSGIDLYEIGESHLATSIANEDFRYAQLSEFVTSVLEHHLPWLSGNLVGWINEARGQVDIDLPELRPDLPALIHFGIDSAEAAELLSSGVRSRRLALVVAAAYRSDGSPSQLREWLADLGVDRWRERFEPAPSEIADLLIFSRVPDANLAAAALDGETVAIDVRLDADDDDSPREVSLRRDSTEDPPSIGIFDAASARLGRVAARHHDDVDRILRVGLPLICALGHGDGGKLELRLKLSTLV
jgi:hypothetical protein